MIELPEALTIARQVSVELKGERIESGIRGNAPHKFALLWPVLASGPGDGQPATIPLEGGPHA